MGKIGGVKRVQVGSLEIQTDASQTVTAVLNGETRESKMAHQGYAGYKGVPRPGQLKFTGVGLTTPVLKKLRDATNETITVVGEGITATLRNGVLVEDLEIDFERVPPRSRSRAPS